MVGVAGVPIPMDLQGPQSRERHREVFQEVMLPLASIVLDLEVGQQWISTATEDAQHLR